MNKTLLLCALALGGTTLCQAAAATEYGTILSKTPAYTQVAVPETQCVNQPVALQPPPSGGGALVGALVGGGLGNAVGAGAGRAAATAVGALAGAVVGNNVEAGSTPPVMASVPQCRTLTRYDNRLVGYDVVYEYNGQRYNARLPNDPGERIALSITPAVTQPPPPLPYAATAVVPGRVVGYAAAPVVYAAPPWVYAPPVYWGPPVGVNIGFGWWGGRGYRGHWR
ncbi:MAG: glycine zipper 2TM domain-containing protein [Proteobacteria bacterium]|nr:glycine zipper 2TM domain-containing protein [Pseudomonadota bacterium]